MTRVPHWLGMLLAASSTAPWVTSCGDADPAGPAEGPELPYRTEHLRILPMPSDAMTQPADTATGRRLVLAEKNYNLGDADEAFFALGEDFARPLDGLDGWSTMGAVFVPTGRPVDPGSMRDRVVLLDLDQQSAVEVELETFDGTTEYGKDVSWVSAKPLRPLSPNTRHGIVVRSGLETSEGELLVRAPAFDAVLADSDFSRLQGVREALRGLGIPEDDVLVADSFTTQSIDEELDAALELVRAQETPVIELTVTATRVDHRALEAVVDFPVLEEAIGESPRVVRWEPVEILVTLPLGPGPFPLVVFQHGLDNRKELLFSDSFVEQLSAAGLAAVAIDAPLHGFRSNGGSAALQFINPARPEVIPENFRHATFDLVYLANHLEALNRPELDLTRVGYLGISLGGIIGAAFVSVEPRIKAAALVVGGAGLSEFVNRYVEGLDLTPYPVKMFGSGMQAIVDRGDPANFAGRAAGKQVLLMQAMQDETIPPKSTLALGRAFGLPVVGDVFEQAIGVEAVASPHARRGWTQFDDAPHDLLGRKTDVARRARAQLFEFLGTWAETGEGVIR